VPPTLKNIVWPGVAVITARTAPPFAPEEPELPPMLPPAALAVMVIVPTQAGTTNVWTEPVKLYVSVTGACAFATSFAKTAKTVKVRAAFLI
jgi:hypothetical protein